MPREMSMRPLSPKSAPSSSSAAAAGGGANPDQISAQSSSDIVSADHDYAVMEELDEENINWGRLCTRVCSIFLLVVIIILVRMHAYIVSLCHDIAPNHPFTLTRLRLEAFISGCTTWRSSSRWRW